MLQTLFALLVTQASTYLVETVPCVVMEELAITVDLVIILLDPLVMVLEQPTPKLAALVILRVPDAAVLVQLIVPPVF